MHLAKGLGTGSVSLRKVKGTNKQSCIVKRCRRYYEAIMDGKNYYLVQKESRCRRGLCSRSDSEKSI